MFFPSLQVRRFIVTSLGTIVDDTHHSFGGTQRLETLDSHIIPFSICSGLPYIDMSLPNPAELDNYSHVLFLSNIDCNPQSIADEYTVHDMDLTENYFQHNMYHPDTFTTYG
jgi:hypothetical protein